MVSLPLFVLLPPPFSTVLHGELGLWVQLRGDVLVVNKRELPLELRGLAVLQRIQTYGDGLLAILARVAD